MTPGGFPFRNLLEYLPGTVIPAVAALASVAVFTRMLPPDAFGMYALAAAAILLIAAALVQWLIQAADRYLPGATSVDELRAVRGTITLATAVIGGAWVAVAGAGLLLLSPHVTAAWREVLLASAGIILLVALLQPALAMLRADMQSRRYSALLGVESILRLALGAALVILLTPRGAALLWGWLIGLALLVPIAWLLVRVPRVTNLRDDSTRTSITLARMSKYGVPMSGWFVASLLLNAGDRYVIQLYHGSADVGIYSASYALTFGAVSTLVAPVFLAAHPFLMRMWGGGEREGTADLLSNMTRWLIAGGIIGTALVLIFARDIASVLLGARFMDGYSIMAPVAAGVFAWQVGLCVHKPLEFHERTRALFGLAAAAAVLNLGLNFMLVPRFGYHAAAYTTLLSYVGYAIAATLLGRRSLPWSFRMQGLPAVAAWTIGGTALAWLARDVITPIGGQLAGLLTAALLMGIISVVVFNRMVRGTRPGELWLTG